MTPTAALDEQIEMHIVRGVRLDAISHDVLFDCARTWIGAHPTGKQADLILDAIVNDRLLPRILQRWLCERRDVGDHDQHIGWAIAQHYAPIVRDRWVAALGRLHEEVA